MSGNSADLPPGRPSLPSLRQALLWVALSVAMVAGLTLLPGSWGTAAGQTVPVCVLTQGYWKTHPEAWPVTGLTLGAVAYDQAQLLAILGEPVRGNGLVALAHQLIAAKLNRASGAPAPAAVARALAEADALIGGLVVPPIGEGALEPAQTSALTSAL